jgi:hypothetical protein
MAHSEPFAQCQGSDPIAQLWQADFYLNKPMKKYFQLEKSFRLAYNVQERAKIAGNPFGLSAPVFVGNHLF